MELRKRIMEGALAEEADHNRRTLRCNKARNNLRQGKVQATAHEGVATPEVSSQANRELNLGRRKLENDVAQEVD